MTPTQNGNTGSRRGPSETTIIQSIVESYRPTDGCPPLSTHWGGHDLAKTEWLKRFAQEIAREDNKNNVDAWNTLKDKCDTSFIIELLYLLTYRGTCRADEDKDAYRLFITEVEKIIPKYDRLGDEIRSLMENPKLSSPMAYIGHDLEQQVKILQEAKERLEAVRDSNVKWCSYKRSARDWYLLLLAGTVKDATGSFHIEALATLIQSALAAHQERSDTINEEAVRKRIQRWIRFMNAKIVGGRLLFRLGQRTDRSASAKPDCTDAPDDSSIPF